MRWTFDYSASPMRVMGPLMGPMIRRTFSKRPAQLAAGLQRGPSAA
jgi:hypothetical protein